MNREEKVALATNLVGYVRTLSALPGYREYAFGPILFGASGVDHPDLNIATTWTAGKDPATPNDFSAFINALRREKVPVTGWVEQGKDEMIGALRAEGFTPTVTSPGMAVSLSRVACAEEIGSDIRAADVRSASDVDEWLDVFANVYTYPPYVLKAYRSLFMRAALATRTDLRLFLVRRGGVGAGCAMSLIAGNTVGVYGVGTRNEFRRSGIGHALTCAVLRHGLDRNCRWGVLWTSPDGRKMYERLGFTEIASYSQFVHWGSRPGAAVRAARKFGLRRLRSLVGR